MNSRTIGEDEWRLRKARSLVKLLALSPEHRLHRERVQDALWPESSSAAAANSLRQTLYVARRVFGPELTSPRRYISLENQELVLCPGGTLWVDVEAFEEAAVTARRSREPAAYRVAVGLYAGELLPNDRYEIWTDARRKQLKETYLSLLVELAKIHEERGEYGPGIEALGQALRRIPHTRKHTLGSYASTPSPDEKEKPWGSTTGSRRLLRGSSRRSPARTPGVCARRSRRVDSLPLARSPKTAGQTLHQNPVYTTYPPPEAALSEGSRR